MLEPILRPILQPVLRSVFDARLRSTAWHPASLFANNEPGFVLPVDPQFLFQNAAGTIPVTAPGQPVGLRLDVSRMQGKSLEQFLAGQPELVVNGGFANGTANWSLSGTGASQAVVDGRLQITRGSDTTFSAQALTTVIGRRYRLAVSFTPGTAIGGIVRAGTVPNGQQNYAGTSSNTPRTEVGYFVATATTTYISMIIAGSAVGSTTFWDDISVKEIPGNHFIQTTGSARPAYQIDGNGKPCLVYDGSDDFMVSAANVDFSATDEMLVCAGLHKASDATTAAVVELSATPTSGTTGTFYLQAPADTTNRYGSLARGDAATSVSQRADLTTGSAPDSAVLSALHDLPGDLSRLRRNGGAWANATGDKGGGNFGNYPVYLGRRGGLTQPFNGRDYGLTVLGRLPTDAELARVEAYYAKAAGVTL